MNRKDFIKRGLWFLGGSAAIQSCIYPSFITNTEDCVLTDEDYEGPFFVNGAPKVVNINTQDLPGVPMTVKGGVYSGGGTSKPVAGAKIEIWHCDHNGAYHPNGSGDVSDYAAKEVTLRGFVITGKDGSYNFKSIMPGYYGTRARHIHYKITVDGHKELITQSYFTGDDRIPHDVQSKNAGDCRILTFKGDDKGVLGTMNFNLEVV
jgi:protocatechuate 3,4-dioxygenase beta subunit